MPILSRNVDQISIETVFSIAICLQWGDKWQSKTLLLSIFDLPVSTVDNVFRLPPTRCGYSLFACWVILNAFLSFADFFAKNSFRNTIKMSNSLDPVLSGLKKTLL